MNEANKLGGGCGVCKSLEEEVYWKHIKRLRFCVAFRPHFRDKLQIPKKFADNVRPIILNPKLTLRGPSGATWEVNLIRSVDGLFLQDGWEDFVNAYSIQENDILFFKYDRNSSFDVKIFDGECEKEAAYFVKKCRHVYPADMNQKKRAVNEIVGDKDHGSDDEVRISTKKPCRNFGTRPVNHMQQVYGLRRCLTTSKKMPSHCKLVQSAINLLRKKAASRSLMKQQERYSDSHEETELAKQREQSGSTNKDVADQNGPANTQLPDQNGLTSKEAPPTNQNPAKVAENIPPAAVFEKVALPGATDGPRKSIGSNNALISPVSTLAETELAKRPAQNGSTSKEVCSAYQNTPEANDTSPPGFDKVSLSKKKGRTGKSLGSKKTTYPVVEYMSNRRSVTDEEKTEAMRKAALELTDNSFFAAMRYTSCYKGFFLTIPASFAAVHLGLMNQEVLLRVGEKIWITKFSFSRGGLGPGWKQFALDNNLEESDACVFKLVSQGNVDTMMFDVTIFRVVDVVTPPTLLEAPKNSP